MTRVLPKDGATPREVAEVVNALVGGKINSIGSVTLNAGATTTTVANAFASKSSVILFAAQTANAAAITEPYVTQANVTEKVGFVITHANDANVDKIFGFAIIG